MEMGEYDFLRQLARYLFTLRLRVIVSWTASFFGEAAIVLVSFLPNGGKPGRRNWRLRSLRDRQSRSTPEMSGAGSDEPIHDAPRPTNAER